MTTQHSHGNIYLASDAASATPAANTIPIADANGKLNDWVDTSGGVTDHGLLTGLADDDHPQYVKHSLATAVSDFLVASGAGAFVKKTLAEVKAILGLGSAAYTASTDYLGAGATAANSDKVDGYHAASLHRTDNMPVCKVQKSSNYTLASNTAYLVEFDTERIDTNGMWSTGAPTALYCVIAGYYLVSGTIRYNTAGNATGIRGCSIKKNGTEIANATYTPNASDPNIVNTTGIVYMAVNDYLQMQAWQTSGVAVLLQASGEYAPSLSVVRVA